MYYSLAQAESPRVNSIIRILDGDPDSPMPPNEPDECSLNGFTHGIYRSLIADRCRQWDHQLDLQHAFETSLDSTGIDLFFRSAQVHSYPTWEELAKVGCTPHALSDQLQSNRCPSGEDIDVHLTDFVSRNAEKFPADAHSETIRVGWKYLSNHSDDPDYEESYASKFLKLYGFNSGWTVDHTLPCGCYIEDLD